MTKHLHEIRGVTFFELGALLGVRSLLSLGLLQWDKHTVARELPKGLTHAFNMRIPCDVDQCASVGCLGGTMGQLMGMDAGMASAYVGGDSHRNPGTRSPSLHVLFFPPHPWDDQWASTDERYDYNYVDWDLITSQVAVKAIDNWLKDGKPRWRTLMKAERDARIKASKRTKRTKRTVGPRKGQYRVARKGR